MSSKTHPAEKSCESRRRFLIRGATVAATAPVAIGCGGGGASSSTSASTSSGGTSGGSATGPTPVAALADVPMGEPMHLEDESLLVWQTDQGVAAMTDVCPHAACQVHPEDGRLHCDCHGSEFNFMGEVLSPPARDNLEWYAVTVTDGQVFVDKDSVVPMGTFAPAN